MAITKRGTLAKGNPVAATDTILYTVPGSRSAIVMIIAANRSATEARVRMGTVDAAGVIDWLTDSIIHDGLCTRDTPVVHTGIALVTDQDVVVRTDNATVSFQVNGIEFDDGF